MTTRRWDMSKPPVGPFTLNRGCPQAFGLVGWWPFGQSGRFCANMANNTLHMARGNSNVIPQPSIGHHPGMPAMRFDRALSHSLSPPSINDAFLNSTPISASGWFMTSNVTNNQDLFTQSTTGASGRERFQLLVNGATQGVNAITADSTTTGSSAGPSSWSPGTWNHAGGVWASDASRTAYLNGQAGTEDTTSVPVTTQNIMNIGTVWFNNSTTNHFDGVIADVMRWGVAVSSEIMRRLYDPSTRFEHWYPLRSPKWISIPVAAGGFQAAWARGANQVVGVGVH